MAAAKSRKVIRIVLSLQCMLLVACASQPNVILFRRYLSAEQVSQISEKLEQTGVQVVSNNLAFPAGMVESSLIYSPMLSQLKVIDSTLSAMSELGWDIYNVSPLSSQNHRFTKNTLGLYLVPDGQFMGFQLPEGSYVSRGCPLDASISFYFNNEYVVHVAEQPAATTPATNASAERAAAYALRGHWYLINQTYLELVPQDSQRKYYFEIGQSIESDVVGEVDITELSPLDKFPPLADCHFVFGIRSR